jgi:surface antigen
MKRFSRYLLLMVAASLCFSPLAWAKAGTVTKKINWSMENDTLSIDNQGFHFQDVVDFTWKGRVVTEQVQQMIDDGTAEIEETADGFKLQIKGADLQVEEPGEFGVMIHSNSGVKLKEVTVEMLASPIPSEKMCGPESSLSAKAAASSCGGFSDSSNPYPCCSNGSRPDGNCTWYAWYRAHQSYRGWGKALPAWGNAKDWASKASKAGYKVSSTPKGYKNGYSIGCNTSGTWGHVAWVYDYDSNYVWVDEMNCCDCSVAGYRSEAKYKRSYFKYISS